MEAEIGIIGGSGFYSLAGNLAEVEMDTPFGRPSSQIGIGNIGGKRVAFISRHGKKHTIPPHKVPYKANIEALRQLGVKRIISSSAIGSLRKEYRPGEIVLFDQFVNMTHGRDDTFFHESPVTHVSSADPYCGELREFAAETAGRIDAKLHKTGTVVVVNGPRFSSRAESRFFKAQGFDVISMTQYPEVMLARERGICYAGIGTITDYDAGLEGSEDIEPVTAKEVSANFAKTVGMVKKMIVEMIPMVRTERMCRCGNALDGAVMG